MESAIFPALVSQRRPPRTVTIILEYCGGERTDQLHAQLSGWNPEGAIMVLDNASPTRRAACVTHRNPRNSYVGGGIRDCIALARSVGAEYLFFCVNDAEFDDPLVVADFQAVMDHDPDLVQISCSLSADSSQARGFPWMVRRPGTVMRRVRSADLIACLLRLDFIESFGGFPPSKGGWGYSAEVAHHARLQRRKIYVSDACAVRHLNARMRLVTERGAVISKHDERSVAYMRRYGDLSLIHLARSAPDFDETEDVHPAAVCDGDGSGHPGIRALPD